MKAWLLALVASLFSLTAAAVTVVDDRGKRVTLPQPAQRIVTLLPSLTETVCALGACERLVGVDDFSNWPARVNALPRVGGLDDARIEAIVALKPDVVLLSSTARALGRLEGLGVPVIGLDIKTLADVERVLGKVGQVLDAPDAASVWRKTHEGIARAARQLPAAARGTRVYFEVGGGYAASESSHIGELLAQLGAANVVPGRLGSVPQLNPEFVLRAAPELIMVSERATQGLLDRPGWRRMDAVRNGRVCVFSAEEADVIMRPGPRLADAARLLARCLRDKGGGP